MPLRSSLRKSFVDAISATVFAAAIGGCGSDHRAAAPAHGFGPVYATVIGPRCLPCHATDVGAIDGHLDMSTEQQAYANLVGVKASGVSCGMSGLTRVVAGSAQTSLLFGKVESPLAMTAAFCGDTMPDDGTTLTRTDVTLIQNWIDDGANR